ncbi:hypothetical protein O3M35_011479 [Rhynocoris fuscipes]|uniref:E3 ubiquitin-protein ligase n=1 Tax=Rhynocoris fuscipes TaxID=488301 RepID=A0AAW1CYN3_9HEMI
MAESLPSSGDKKEYPLRCRKRSLETQDEDQVTKSLAVIEKGDKATKNESEDNVPDCAICLQTCVHPAKLPCGHIFCFLCIKGIVHSGWRCAMCRATIPHDYLDSPLLVNTPKVVALEKKTVQSDDKEDYQWFYEGRHGWWRYDERANAELEAAYSRSEDSITLLIAGYLYEVDLIDLIQFRKTEPNRRRRIKRDVITAPSKGVAGLREDTTDLAATFSRLVINEDDRCVSSVDEQIV